MEIEKQYKKETKLKRPAKPIYKFMGCRKCGSIFSVPVETQSPCCCYNPVCRTGYATEFCTQNIDELELELLAVKSFIALHTMKLNITQTDLITTDVTYAPFITIHPMNSEIAQALSVCALPKVEEYPLINMHKSNDNKDRTSIILQGGPVQLSEYSNGIIDALDAITTIKHQIIMAAKRIIKEAAGIYQYRKNSGGKYNNEVRY